jgi:hypothetical protein
VLVRCGLSPCDKSTCNSTTFCTFSTHSQLPARSPPPANIVFAHRQRPLGYCPIRGVSCMRDVCASCLLPKHRPCRPSQFPVHVTVHPFSHADTTFNAILPHRTHSQALQKQVTMRQSNVPKGKQPRVKPLGQFVINCREISKMANGGSGVRRDAAGKVLEEDSFFPVLRWVRATELCT